MAIAVIPELALCIPGIHWAGPRINAEKEDVMELKRMAPYNLPISLFPPHAGGQTPWGLADDSRMIGTGIYSVTTPSHGGIWLSPEVNSLIPDQFRRSDQWYEEDCEAIIALAFTRELITDQAAWSFCQNGLDEALEAMFPSIFQYIVSRQFDSNVACPECGKTYDCVTGFPFSCWDCQTIVKVS